MDFYALTQQCGGNQFQEQAVAAAITHTESTYNPFAIGVVGSAVRQPRTLPEAIQSVRYLSKNGYNYSVGLMQVNKTNFASYGLHEGNMFDPCTNVRTGITIFRKCYDTAHKTFGNKYSYDGKLRLAASCYYSGNFKTGFIPDFKGQPSYVTKFYNNLIKYRGGNSSYTQPMVATTQKLPIQQAIPVATVVNAQQSANNGAGNSYLSLVDAINEQKKEVEAKAAELAVVETNNTTTPTPTKNDNVLYANDSVTPKQNHNTWDIFQDFH